MNLLWAQSESILHSIAVHVKYRNTGMVTNSSSVESLAESRRRSHQYRHHLDFLADNYVDQALVKAALLQGLSQTETAKVLGMSKKTVNMHSRRPWHPYAVAKGTGIPEADDAFYRFVWGSEHEATVAIATCQRYDRERLDIEHTP